jgi:hypothetical protein
MLGRGRLASKAGEGDPPRARLVEAGGGGEPLARRPPPALITRSGVLCYCFFSIPSAATNGVLVAGPSPHTRIVAGSVFAPS